MDLYFDIFSFYSFHFFGYTAGMRCRYRHLKVSWTLHSCISLQDTIRKISEVPTNPWQYPERDIEIVDCGVLPLSKPYDLTDKELATNGDIKVAKPSQPDNKEL